jgi:thiol-disulfide isomerase/thioredoxin
MTKAKIFFISIAAASIALLAGIYAGAQRTNSPQHTAPHLAEKNIGRLFSSTLLDTSEKSYSFAQWRGKILVVNFWAAWCPPCRDEMPGFSRLQTKFAANGVQFVGIALDSSDMVREFALQHPSTYPLVIGGTEGVELARLLGNPQLALPYTLIINATGEVRFARLGGLSEQELDALLRESTAR